MNAVGRATRIGGCGRCTPPPGISFRRLYESAGVRVNDVVCCPATHGLQGEEEAGESSIVLTRAGVFMKHVRGERVVADANHVLFFNGGEPYRVSHPGGCGDRCTRFRLAPGVLAEVLAAHDRSAPDHPEVPFLATHGPSTAEAYLLHRRLLELVRTTPPDVAIDGLVYDLVDSLLGAVYARRERGGWGVRAGTEAAHGELVEGAKVELNRAFRGRVTLDGLAAAVHSSPYHLSRVFRRRTGLPVHRYLNRLRLRAALDAIAGDRPEGVDLSRVAHSVGFFDHSHFSNAFRREFGVPPSACRGAGTARELREMSKKFQVGTGARS